MKNNSMLGVILAGGKGSRMYPFGERYPKCILPVCNKPLIEYQIEMMKNMGIEDIIIVIGQYGFDIVRIVGAGESYGVHINYVDQGEPLGIAHALGNLERFIDRPFLLFLGDIFFITESLSPMVEEFEREEVNAVLATKVEPDQSAIMRNFTVIKDDNGFVKRVIEKPRHPLNNLKGCGIYLFDLHIFDAVRRTPRTAMRDEYEITDSIQILINDSFKITAAEVIQEDLNLTYPEDLLYCNLRELKRRKKIRFIGKNTQIQNQRLIQNAVVGDNVSLRSEAEIKNSVIFSNSVIDSQNDIYNTIVTPEQTIPCYRSTPQEDSK